MGTHPQNFYIFYYCKYHCDRQGSIWFRSLGFGKRNGYLKDVAPIDAK